MSSSDERLSTETADLARRLAASPPDGVSDAALQSLLSAAVRVYAAKSESRRLRAFPPGGEGVTTTDVMLIVTAMLHASNTQLFELAMWQAWTGAHALHPGQAA